MKFKNKIFFITGANRGIGKALVQAALTKDASKIYAASRTLSNLPDFNNERVIPIELDITNSSQIERATHMAGDTQILINNAGVVRAGNILDGQLQQIRYEMEVNYFSTLNVMRAFVPILERNQSSRIVNIVSIAAYSNFPFIAGYSASKAALYSATQAARIELSKRGITVHAVNPGAIDTDMNKGSGMKNMTSPKNVAISILNGVEDEKLDIIPDNIGQNFYDLWRKDPSALEAAAAEMYFSQ